MYTLELAEMDDVELCSQIIEEGRQFQREQGFVQWTDEYPNLDTIRGDAAAGIGYILKADGMPAGYMCIDFSGEPAYADIEGKWSSNQAYAVIHRMAFDRKFRGIGLVDTAFALIEKLCLENKIAYIRADTDFPNKRMQHILSKNGFKECGVIVFQGSGKIAYDKLLS
ncbi:MAG: GNAT family N-acetyltransferase [Lachnospiraceae bacterium]|nr:GNAT family N-acetyltransferase [Lachnospiraceae bacterium]